MFIKNKRTCTIYLVTKNKRKWKLGFYREILLTGYYIEFDIFSKNYQKIIREDITIGHKSKDIPLFNEVDSWRIAKISEIFNYKILQMSYYLDQNKLHL